MLDSIARAFFQLRALRRCFHVPMHFCVVASSRRSLQKGAHSLLLLRLIVIILLVAAAKERRNLHHDHMAQAQEKMTTNLMIAVILGCESCQRLYRRAGTSASERQGRQLARRCWLSLRRRQVVDRANHDAKTTAAENIGKFANAQACVRRREL